MYLPVLTWTIKYLSKSIHLYLYRRSTHTDTYNRIIFNQHTVPGYWEHASHNIVRYSAVLHETRNDLELISGGLIRVQGKPITYTSGIVLIYFSRN